MTELRVGDRVKVNQITAYAQDDKSYMVDLITNRLGDVGIITRPVEESDYAVDFGGGDEDCFSHDELVPVGNREWQAVMEAEREQGIEREY